jgi:multiple sugar transport system permease protein
MYSLNKRKNLFYFSVVSPAIIFVFGIFGYLLFRVFQMSFFEYKPLLHIYNFVGLKNYIYTLSDKYFIGAISRNIIYTIVVVFFSFVIGMIEALIINSNFRGNSILRVVFMVPMMFIPAAAGVVWIMLYNTDFGWVNQLISIFGGTRISFLASWKWAFWAVVTTDIWGWSPFMFLILLAGLKSLPVEPFEAASIDGASKFQVFHYITLPLMKPVIIIALTLKTIDTFRAFDYMWVMTQGGPGNFSQILSTIIYRYAFRIFNFGLGAAMSVCALIVSLILSIILFIFYFRERAVE